VTNKYAIKTSWDEQTVTEPADIQASIDAEIAKYDLSRCFVRPSGTEDVLRVYAEARNKEELDK